MVYHILIRGSVSRKLKKKNIYQKVPERESLQFAIDELIDDKEFIFYVMNEDIDCLAFAGARVLGDANFILKAVKKDFRIVQRTKLVVDAKTAACICDRKLLEASQSPDEDQELMKLLRGQSGGANSMNAGSEQPTQGLTNQSNNAGNGQSEGNSGNIDGGSKESEVNSNSSNATISNPTRCLSPEEEAFQRTISSEYFVREVKEVLLNGALKDGVVKDHRALRECLEALGISMDAEATSSSTPSSKSTANSESEHSDFVEKLYQIDPAFRLQEYQTDPVAAPAQKSDRLAFFGKKMWG
jgi:hypothetical protein